MGKHPFLVFLRYLILLLGTAIIAYGIIQFSNKPIAEKARTPVPVIIATPLKGTLHESISLQAHIESDQMVVLLPLVSGELESVSFELGDQVSEGQVLAQIDAEPYVQQQAQATAAKEIAQSTYIRIERLYQAKAATEQIYDEARANRDATLAQWELATLQLKNTAIKAPITGTVLQKYATSGTIASPQQPIALIADFNALIVQAHLPASYFDTIHKYKDALELTVSRTDGGGGVHSSQAKLKAISPSIDPESNTFSLVCTLPEGTDSFVPGMAVTLQIIYNSVEPAYLLRQEDRTVDGAFYRYDASTETARYEQVPIEAENDTFVAVDAAYRDASFIVGGQYTLLDGQPVTVQKTR